MDFFSNSLLEMQNAFIYSLCIFILISATEDQLKDGKNGDHEHAATKYDSMDKLKRAAASALSAAAVKAKLLADREVDQIRHLAILLAEKQVFSYPYELISCSLLQFAIASLSDRSLMK